MAEPSSELVPAPAPVVLQDAYDLAQKLLDTQIRPLHGPLLASLAGNGPAVVPKSGRSPYFGRPVVPIEDQLEQRP